MIRRRCSSLSEGAHAFCMSRVVPPSQRYSGPRCAVQVPQSEDHCAGTAFHQLRHSPRTHIFCARLRKARWSQRSSTARTKSSWFVVEAPPTLTNMLTVGMFPKPSQSVCILLQPPSIQPAAVATVRAAAASSKIKFLPPAQPTPLPCVGSDRTQWRPQCVTIPWKLIVVGQRGSARDMRRIALRATALASLRPATLQPLCAWRMT